MTKTQIDTLNMFTGNLPGDDEKENFTRQVFGACYSEVSPRKPKAPEWVHFNEGLGRELGLEQSDEVLALLSGEKGFPGFTPYAMCYGGHQFGHWAGQLGDGRAINVGERKWGSGAESVHTVQLKGSGKTPYSRGADGLAVLRSSVREYLCSEAMFHLGVPTTRALSLVLTGDMVERDMLYDGNPALEKGAIVARTASSFLRFGSFEIFSSREDSESLRTLADFAIENYFPHLGTPSKETYIAFFKEVVGSTLDLMLEWERVGFVHGVMNTDNMSILGLTIDYGPYGWLENYDKDWTPNTTDAQHRRYRFGQQGMIGLWNLVQFANSLYPLIGDVEPLESALKDYREEFERRRLEQIGMKIGLREYADDLPVLGSDLEVLLSETEMDMTMFYRNLNKFDPENSGDFETVLTGASYAVEFDFGRWAGWLDRYSKALVSENRPVAERLDEMNRVNPKYVLRNYMAQLAIDKADEGDNSLVDELYRLLEKPYDEQPEMERWFAKRPDWAKNRVGCSMLSCSS